MQDLEISHQNPTLEATTVAKSTIYSVFTVFYTTKFEFGKSSDRSESVFYASMSDCG